LFGMRRHAASGRRGEEAPTVPLAAVLSSALKFPRVTHLGRSHWVREFPIGARS
jgi:hypothetical protein